MSTTGAGAIDVKLTADTVAFDSSMDKSAAITERSMQRMSRAQAAAKADGDRFVKSIQGQIDAFGLTGTALLAYQAKLKGVQDVAQPLIDRLNKMKDAQAAFNTQAASATGVGNLAKGFEEANTAAEHASRGTAGITRELLVLAHEASQGNFKRFGGSLLVLAEYSATAQAAIRSLMGPIGALIAVAAAVAYEVYEGAKALDTFNKSLLLTGRYAGLTADSFSAMSQKVASAANATVGKAGEALQGLVSSGLFGPQVLGPATEATLRLASITGKTAEDVVADFSKMSDGVAKYAAEHDKSMHLLSAAQYEQIKSLEESGKSIEAQGVYFSALNDRLREHDKEVSELGKYWTEVKNVVSGYVQAVANIGKGNSIGTQLALERQKLADMEQANASKGIFGLSGRFAAEIEDSKKIITALESSAHLQEQVAAATAASAKRQDDAKSASDYLEGLNKKAKGADNLRKALDNLKRQQDAYDAVRPADQRLSVAARESQRQEVIKENTPHASLTTDDVAIERAKKAIELDQATYEERERMLKLYQSNGLIDDKDYYAGREAAQAEYLSKVKAGYEAEIALIRARASSSKGDQQVKYLKELADAQEKYRQALNKGASAGSEDQITRAGKAQQELNKLREADAAAVAKQIESLEKANQVERDAAEQAGKTKIQIDGEKIARLELAAAKEQEKIATMELFGFGEQEIAQQKVILGLLQEDIAMKKQALAASTSFATGARTAFSKYQESATNSAAFAEQFITGSFSRLEDAVVKFAETGKFSLGGIFQFMADEFIRQTARMLVAESAANSGGLFTSIAGWIGTAASLYSGSYNSNYSNEGLNHSAPVSAASGMNYVPYDGMPAVLHRGEAVVPAAYNPAAGAKIGNGNVVLNVTNSTGVQAKATSSQRQTDQGTVVELVLVAVANDVKTGGRTHDAIAQRFGLNSGGSMPRY